jgi:hypothetical protein
MEVEDGFLGGRHLHLYTGDATDELIDYFRPIKTDVEAAYNES